MAFWLLFVEIYSRASTLAFMIKHEIFDHIPRTAKASSLPFAKENIHSINEILKNPMNIFWTDCSRSCREAGCWSWGTLGPPSTPETRGWTDKTFDQSRTHFLAEKRNEKKKPRESAVSLYFSAILMPSAQFWPTAKKIPILKNCWWVRNWPSSGV